MQQTREAEAFITRISTLLKGPGVSLDEVLQVSLDDEAELRKLFATDKENARLKDPHVGPADAPAAPPVSRITRARIGKDDHDFSAKYAMPLNDADRRKEGSLGMVANLDEFKMNWAIFTESSFLNC